MRDESQTVQHFTDLLVWQKANTLFVQLALELEHLPPSPASRIVIDQLLRSIGAVSANIAEGFNAPSTKEYVYYLDRAKRSSHEAENWLYKLRDLHLLAEEVTVSFVSLCVEIARMLHGLSAALSERRAGTLLSSASHLSSRI